MHVYYKYHVWNAILFKGDALTRVMLEENMKYRIKRKWWERLLFKEVYWNPNTNQKDRIGRFDFD